jgi:hypothetical protein
MISAAMLTAVSSGVLAPRSRPTGLDSRDRSLLVNPAARKRSKRSWCVWREPMAPTYANRGSRRASCEPAFRRQSAAAEGDRSRIRGPQGERSGGNTGPGGETK